MPRDQVESDIGKLVQALQPTQQLMTLARVMFRHAWDQRLAQAQEVVKAGQMQVKAVEKQIETLLGRIIASSHQPMTPLSAPMKTRSRNWSAAG